LGRRFGRTPPFRKLSAATCPLPQYMDYSVRHFYEKWREERGETRSYNWVRLTLQGSDLAEKAPARGKHRRKRERPFPG
jgi:hypothetical protein